MTGVVSETVTTKVHRLLTSGSVTVVGRVGQEITATVLGDHGRYEVRRRRGGWSCTCANYMRCSHMTAVMTVCGGER